MVSVMSVRMRPNDDALVISRVTPSGVVIVQRYSAWVWADTMTLIDGSSRSAISAMSLPARLPAQPFRRRRARLEAALVDHEHARVHALLLSCSRPRWRRRPRPGRSARRRRSA